MAKYKLGLVDIMMGPVGAGGTMGTALTPVGNTVADSPTFNTDDPTKQDFNIEEQDNPVLSITTAPGSETFSWNCYDVDTATLQRLFGGTVIAATDGQPARWNAPAQIPEIEQSISLRWRGGGGLDIPRAKVTSKLSLSFKKTALSQIDIVADILQPEDGDTPNKIIIPA